MSLCILDLPTELLCRVLAYLDVLDLYHCSLVSRYYLSITRQFQPQLTNLPVPETLWQTCVSLRQIIEESVELQLDMKLGIHRMVCADPLSSGPSLSTRLEELNRRQNAWRYLRLNLDDRYTSECPGSAYGFEIYEYLGSVFSFGRPQSASFVQLHSTSESDLEMPLTWSHSMDAPLREYTTDSAQDLMIIVEDAPEG
jgi:hypothetical protein